MLLHIHYKDFRNLSKHELFSFNTTCILLDTFLFELKHQETERDLSIWSFSTAQTLQLTLHWASQRQGKRRGLQQHTAVPAVTMTVELSARILSSYSCPFPHIVRKGDHKQIGTVGGLNIWDIQMECNLTIQTQCHILKD